jgi:branched-subunit amino acid ABC-type transport system permease component
LRNYTPLKILCRKAWGATLTGLSIWGPLLAVALCDALTLTVLVYGLATARCTTNSYHLDLIPLAILAPSVAGALTESRAFDPVSAVILGVAGAVAVKCLATHFIFRPAIFRRSSPLTLTVISFSLFQMIMIGFTVFLSNKAFASSLSHANLFGTRHGFSIAVDQAVIIVAGVALVALLSLISRKTLLVVLLKALRENPDLLTEFGYNKAQLVWIGVLLSSLLVCSSGFLILAKGSVSSANVYSLFLLSFSVLLVAGDINLKAIFLTSGLVCLTSQIVFAFFSALHERVVSAGFFFVACFCRYYADRSK